MQGRQESISSDKLCVRKRTESKETWIKGTHDGKRKIKSGERERNRTNRAELKFRTKQTYLSFAAEENKAKEGTEQPHRKVTTMKARGNLKGLHQWSQCNITSFLKCSEHLNLLTNVAPKRTVKRVPFPLPSMISPEFLQKPLWEKIFCYGENNRDTVKAKTAQLEIHIVFRLHFWWFANHQLVFIYSCRWGLYPT